LEQTGISTVVMGCAKDVVESGEWKLDWPGPARMSPEEIARRRTDWDKVKQIGQSVRNAAITPAKRRIA
jgi:hypothetical protein